MTIKFIFTTNSGGSRVSSLFKLSGVALGLATILAGCHPKSPSIESLMPSEKAVVSGYPSAPPRQLKSAVVWGNDTRTVNTAILWLQKHGIAVYGPSVLQQTLAKEIAKGKISIIDEGAVVSAARETGADSVVFADRVGDSRPPMVSVRGVDISNGRILMSGSARYESFEALPSNDSLSILTDQALMSAWGIQPEQVDH